MRIPSQRQYDGTVMKQAGEPGWKSGKIARCPECKVRRNKFHAEGCFLSVPKE